MDLKIDTDRILVGDRWWRFDKHVLQAKKIGDRVLVIFDYMAYPQGRPAANLVAFDEHQKKMWEARNPSDRPTDAFVNFLSEDPFRVWNFAGYQCEIDLATGGLLKSEFCK
jgi:hypothetical protein